jgi:hypothetical protein
VATVFRPPGPGFEGALWPSTCGLQQAANSEEV